MDDERVELEGLVSGLEQDVSELDENHIADEEVVRLRRELDAAYERLDGSGLSDEDTDALMDRLDDLQDILDDLTDDGWDEEAEAQENEEEDEEEDEEKTKDDDEG
ncbi:MAG: hypothetical protein Q7V53_00120 [Caldisericota bacterium]|nr:hypothetical protein [Caldisericota bacterium]